MSMSWDHKCEKCGKEFSNFCPRDPYCYDCTQYVSIDSLDDSLLFKCTNFGGGEFEMVPLKLLKQIFSGSGDYEKIPINDRGFHFVLEYDEIVELEMRMGKELSINHDRIRAKYYK